MINRISQSDRLIAAFHCHSNVLSLPQMLDLRIAKYSSRITDLRKRGYIIDCEELGTLNGMRRTQYRLTGEPEVFLGHADTSLKQKEPLTLFPLEEMPRDFKLARQYH